MTEEMLIFRSMHLGCIKQTPVRGGTFAWCAVAWWDREGYVSKETNRKSTKESVIIKVYKDVSSELETEISEPTLSV